MKFGIPLDRVEQRSIVDYRLMQFTVINMAALESGMGGFRFQTDEEEMDEFAAQIEHFKRRGIL